MKIKIDTRGGFTKSLHEMDRLSKIPNKTSILKNAGRVGLDRLKGATPSRTGRTASSWEMEVNAGASNSDLTYYNSSITRDGTPIVILLQNGHGTGTGGYVRGNDFITPIIDDVIHDIAKNIERELRDV